MSNNDQNQMYGVMIQTITAASQLPFVKVILSIIMCKHSSRVEEC